jgi:hypothetical protein
MSRTGRRELECDLVVLDSEDIGPAGSEDPDVNCARFGVYWIMMGTQRGDNDISC